IVEMRRIENEKIEALRPAGNDGRWPAEQVGNAKDRFPVLHSCDHRRITRDEGTDLDVVSSERRRQRSDYIRKAAGLDQWENLGSDSEYAGCHCPSLSIIGWVIRQIPF